MADSSDETTTEEPVVDEARSALLEAIAADLGHDLVGSHLLPGKDLWIRVSSESWGATAEYLQNHQQFRFFNFLSVIDWLPSPYGRSNDSAVEVSLAQAAGESIEEADQTLGTGYGGGSTRFQVLARVHSLTTNLGLTVKADFPEDTLSVGTWVKEYPGANWHEREAAEMFGVHFAGHPGLTALYLPSAFEGHPLRKDFPLLSRIVKPWPGIVDVEPMPEAVEPPTAEPKLSPSASTENPQDVPS